MQKILGWLEKSSEFQICRMNDDMILNRPIEEWLRCDILIGFYSYGFPLQKAIDYVEKYKPKMINDLSMQSILWDRPTVLERLRKRGIPIAKSYVVLRGEDKIRAQRKERQSQEEIEAQSKKTKDNGQHYIEEARKLQQIQVTSPKSLTDHKQFQSQFQ